MDDFHGYHVQRLSSKFLQVDCLSSAGPRIVGLRYKGSANLLADVAETSIDTPYGTYRYLGGHRLWHAPESMPRSYIPDDSGLTLSELPDGVALQGSVEVGTGIRKSVEVHLDSDQPRLRLVHTLSNESLWDVELAPWAITMFRLGGTAILPIRGEQVYLDSLLPDRHISVWSYVRMDDPRLKLQDEFIAIRPIPGLSPFKVGTFNPRGWTAYWLENVLFRKTYTVHLGLSHPDYGCNAELYCDGHFIELESVGPLRRLEPGQSLTHEEVWEFYDSIDQGFLSQGMKQLLGADVV